MNTRRAWVLVRKEVITMTDAEPISDAEAAHRYRLHQAEDLMREAGYREVEPGKWAKDEEGHDESEG